MSILKPSDFTGFQGVAGSIENDPKLQSFIDKYEQTYINKVFGIKMGKLVFANIVSPATSPTNVNYKKVWDAFQEVGPNDEQWVSEGMIEILKSSIFHNYVSFGAAQHTQAGVTQPQVDTQKDANTARFAESRWNNMLMSWEAIQLYIHQNEDTFPDYVELKKPDYKFDGLL